MTSYNRDWLLDRALRSVLVQSYTDFVVYLIDDNSENPMTSQVIDRFLEVDKRIIPIYRKTTEYERGKKATFCVGINKILKYIKNNTEHSYITFITCDGFFYPQKLQACTSFMEKNKKINNIYHPVQRSVLLGSRVSMCKDILPSVIGVIRSPQCRIDHESIMMRTKLLDKLTYPYWPEKKMHEFTSPDGMFFEKLVKVGGPFHPVRATLGAKLCHSDSIQGRFFGFGWPLLRP